MGVIVVVCEALSFVVSEAKTEIMYLRRKRMPEVTTIFSVEAADQVHNQMKGLYTSGETSTTTPSCPSTPTGAYATHGAPSGSAPSKCTTDRALLSIPQSRC